MIMECDAVVQNGVPGYDMCSTPALPDKDCCDVKCYDVKQKSTSKSVVPLLMDSISIKNAEKGVSAALSTQTEPDINDIRSLICDEVIIDGFSVLSFKSKKDLMLYSDHCEAERRKIASAYKEEEHSKRSKRSASGRQKRPKLLFKRTLLDRTLSESSTQGDVLQDDENTYKNMTSTNNVESGNSAHNNSKTEGPSGIAYDLVPYVVSSNTSQIHSSERDQHATSTASGSDGTDANGPGKISPLRLSRINKADMTRSENHTNVHHSAPTPNSDPGRDSNLAGAPDLSTRFTPVKHSPSSSTPSYPSSPGSILSTARNCHLTPLSVTWNPPVLHPSPTSTSDHWTPNSRSAGGASVLDSDVADRPHSSEIQSQTGAGSQISSKRGPCHQFSVAALTDEPVNVSCTPSSPAESRSTPVMSTGKSATRRSGQLRSKPGARTSGLHSPVSTTDENSLSHSFPSNYLPTAPRSGSSSPFSHPQPHIYHSQILPDKSVPPVCLNNQFPSELNRSSGEYSWVHQAVMNETQPRLDKPHSFSTGLPRFSSPSSSNSVPMGRPSPAPSLNSGVSKSHGSLPPPPTVLQSRAPPSISNMSGAGMYPSQVPIPDPHLLQQMLGVDLNMATQLLKDPRFKDLYSRTMANLTSTDKKLNTSKPSSSSLLTSRPSQTVNRATENGTATTVSTSSLNALVKLASTDPVSPSSMDMLLHFRSMPESNQTGLPVPHVATATPPALKPADPGRTPNVLHSAYHDRELLTRIPSINEPAKVTDSLSHGRSQPPPPHHHGNNDPATIKVLPPPPPLTAGHLPDSDSPMGELLPHDHTRPRYPNLPPLSMMNNANALSVSRATPNNMVVRAPRPPSSSSLPTSTQLPDAFSGNPMLQSHWELFFRQMLGRQPGPAGFSGPNSHGVETGAGSHSNHSTGTAVAGTPLPAVAPPMHPPPHLSFPPSSSQSTAKPVIPPPPLPPPYSLNSTSHLQAVRAPLSAGSTVGGPATSAPKHPPSSSGSLLYRRIHPDKSCGRWADAHIRIARFIHLCQSVRPSHPLQEDPRLTSSGTVFPLSHSVLRPIPRLDQQHPPALRPNLGMGTHPPHLHSPQLPSGPRQWDNLTHPRHLNLPPACTTSSGTMNLPTAELEKNPLWNYLINSVTANLSPSDPRQVNPMPGTEAMDAFWTSVLQSLTRQTNPANSTQNSSSNHITTTTPSIVTEKQHGQHGSSRSSSGLPSVSSETAQPNTEHIPHLGPRHAPFNPPVFSHPMNPVRHGNHPSPGNSIYPPFNQMEVGSGRLGVDTKRPRFDPGHGPFDQAHQTPFPLLQRLSHPNAMATSAPHQQKPNMMQVAANLLNGFHGFTTAPSGNVMHQTAPGLNEPSGSDGSEKSRLKMGAAAPHCAPIHRW